MAVVSVVLVLAFLAAHVASIVICFMKGKPVFGVLGLLVAGPFAWVGAIRLAKPDSGWAERYGLGSHKANTAKRRFPKEATWGNEAFQQH